MSPGPVRVPVPAAVVGTVIALCALLLLKWLAVVALAVGGVVALVGWLWRRRHGGAGSAPAPHVLPEPRRPRDAGLELLLPAAAADCTWCGRSGGHRDLRGDVVRPRHAHARDLARRS